MIRAPPRLHAPAPPFPNTTLCRAGEAAGVVAAHGDRADRGIELAEIDRGGGGGAVGEVDDAALARRGADRDGVRLIGDRSLPQRHRARRGGVGVLAERGAETTRSGGGGPEGAGALALRGCPFTAVPQGVARTSCVSGKSVAGRGDSGGRRTIQTKKH